jgi:hypothetical protein
VIAVDAGAVDLDASTRRRCPRGAHLARGHRLDVGRLDVAVDELRPGATSRTWREATGSTWDGSPSVDELRPGAASRTWREVTGSTWDGSPSVDELRPGAMSHTWREATGSTWPGSTSTPWTSRAASHTWREAGST